MLLYELFKGWIVVSVTGIVASMVPGALLCLWCALRVK
jgi:hypothetical protein